MPSTAPTLKEPMSNVCARLGAVFAVLALLMAASTAACTWSPALPAEATPAQGGAGGLTGAAGTPPLTGTGGVPVGNGTMGVAGSTITGGGPGQMVPIPADY
ncbi:MAG: hypothetical protein JWM82_2305, partial [Myxococcales bacterium]|nr:hypothetical protein [Myxococcales bacterium]